MAGGTNKIRRPGYTPGGPGADRPGGQNVGGQMPPQFAQPGFATGGPYGPGPGGVPPQWGQPGQQQPTPDHMEEWKKQFGNWNPADDKPGQFPPMNIPGRRPGGNIPGLLAGGGQNNPPGFPGYNNLPKNWQDDGYSWQDPNNPDATYNIIA